MSTSDLKKLAFAMGGVLRDVSDTTRAQTEHALAAVIDRIDSVESKTQMNVKELRREAREMMRDGQPLSDNILRELRRIEKLAAERSHGVHSWRFVVHRDAAGFIASIEAFPVQ